MRLRDGQTYSRRGLLMALLPWPAAAEASRGIRHYTATATVTFLGVTLVTRKGAGSGFARAEESGGTTVLEFGAGSHPERCAGINRLGYIREVVETTATGGRRRRMFGFMTSSREESLQEARRALGGRQPAHAYTMLESAGDAAGIESRVASVACSAALSWPRWQEVESELMEAWKPAPKRTARIEGEKPGFLSVVRHAMRRGGSGREPYAHYDKTYTLEWRTRPLAGGMSELEGRISGGGKAKFRLWYDPSRPCDPPWEFEFQPRAFLRLLFESVTEEKTG
jgi:hypothetical protein